VLGIALPKHSIIQTRAWRGHGSPAGELKTTPASTSVAVEVWKHTSPPHLPYSPGPTWCPLPRAAPTQ